MATVAEMRAWLRDQGEDPGQRGKLRPDLVARYDEAHTSAFDTPADDPDWDLGGDDPLADPDDLEPSVPMQPERAPRTARSQRAERRAQPVGQRTGRILNALRGDQGPKGKPKPKAKPKPRMSLERFTSRAYTSLGRMVSAVAPATGRCIGAQAPMAGVLLEDMAQGTLIDRFLQPAARAEDKLDKGFALMAPPLIVFAMEMNQQAVLTGQRTQQQGMVRQAMLTPILRESLRIGLDVSAKFADQIKANLERNAEMEAQVDQLLALIFEPPPEPVPEPEMAGAAE